MIPYTERDTDLNFRPPYRITGVEALSAVRGIDREAAQQWVDETLNWRPPGQEPKPEFTALPVAFVIFMKMAEMRSIHAPHYDWGSVSESEMVVTLPLLEWDNRGLPSPPKLCFYPIVLCLDSGPALISGREAFGFPKIMGQVEIGADRGEARCEVATFPGDPFTRRNQLLLSLSQAADSAEERPAVIHDSFSTCLVEMVREELMGNLRRSRIDDILRARWGRGILNLGLEGLVAVLEKLEVSQDFVFLKQFRDVERPDRACHRSVASCPLEFSNLTHLSREAGDWVLEVPDHRSSALLKRIGLSSGSIGAPLRAHFQIDLSLGKTLWSA
jgi:Acetoacetate decarboxylase (ADC)